MWSVRSLPISHYLPNRHLVTSLVRLDGLQRYYYFHPRREQRMMHLPVEQLLSQTCPLSDEFRRCSEIRYIDQAIILNREALDICTPGHPKRPNCLVALSWHIWTRYEHLGGVENINEAIVLGQEALTLCPPGHSLQSLSFNNLAAYLWCRYE